MSTTKRAKPEEYELLPYHLFAAWNAAYNKLPANEVESTAGLIDAAYLTVDESNVVEWLALATSPTTARTTASRWSHSCHG